MALILSIESASVTCSVALCREGRAIRLRETAEDRSHATKLTIFIQELLEEQGIAASGLDAVSLSLGPGSYTGLRIGASVAKGLAYGAGLPIIGIPTLQSLAAGFLLTRESELSAIPGEPPLLCPMLDARRMEVYAALYDVHLEEVMPTDAIILDDSTLFNILNDRRIWFFGNGSDKASELIRHPNARFFGGLQLSAAWQAGLAEGLYRTGAFLDTAYFEPHYLKEFIASIPKNRILG